MSLVRKNNFILLKVSAAIFVIIMIMAQSFINQKNIQLEYQRKMLKLVEYTSQARVANNEYSLYQVGSYADGDNITAYSFELVDAGKDIARSTDAVTDYINKLIDITIKESRSIFLRIIVILNWVLD